MNSHSKKETNAMRQENSRANEGYQVSVSRLKIRVAFALVVLVLIAHFVFAKMVSEPYPSIVLPGFARSHRSYIVLVPTFELSMQDGRRLQVKQTELFYPLRPIQIRSAYLYPLLSRQRDLGNASSQKRQRLRKLIRRNITRAAIPGYAERLLIQWYRLKRVNGILVHERMPKHAITLELSDEISR